MTGVFPRLEDICAKEDGVTSIVAKDLWAEENIIDSDSYFTEEEGPYEEENDSNTDCELSVREAGNLEQ